MKTPHKYAELIKAWADGAVIQLNDNGVWRDVNPYGWDMYLEYRIKPEPKPDYIIYPESVESRDGYDKQLWYVKDKLKLTFSGETGRLKSAEVL